MVGLALALKATAAGLVVAIPATMFYNGLMRRVDTKVAQWLALPSKKGAAKKPVSKQQSVQNQ